MRGIPWPWWSSFKTANTTTTRLSLRGERPSGETVSPIRPPTRTYLLPTSLWICLIFILSPLYLHLSRLEKVFPFPVSYRLSIPGMSFYLINNFPAQIPCCPLFRHWPSHLAFPHKFRDLKLHFKVVMCTTKVDPGCRNSDSSPKVGLSDIRSMAHVHVRQNVWEWHTMTRTDHVDPTSTTYHLSKERSRIVTNRHCRILSWGGLKTWLASQATRTPQFLDKYWLVSIRRRKAET